MWQNPTNREELDSGKILCNFDLKMDTILDENKPIETESKKVGSVGGVGVRVRLKSCDLQCFYPSQKNLREVASSYPKK